MRSVIISKILFIVVSILLVAPFVIVPTLSMLICLELTVFNPTPPPVELNDYIRWKIARDKMCDWPGDFVPAIIFAVTMYIVYSLTFTAIESSTAKKKSNIITEDFS